MRIRSLATFLSALLLSAPALPGDCDPHWLPGEGFRGTDTGRIHSSTLWDPDGPGPLSTKLVVAGQFNAIGALNARNIALYDPATEEWSPFPSTSFTPFIQSVHTAADGSLLALGVTTNSSGYSGQVFQWSGEQWLTLGDTFNNYFTTDPCILPDGDLIVAGEFTMVGNTPANHVARWDGAQWHPLADGITGAPGIYPPRVTALLALPDGDLIVGGDFLNAGGQPSPKFARWNGAEWTPMTGSMNGYVADLALRTNGEIIAACNANDRGLVFRWTGTHWAGFTPVLFGYGAIGTILPLPDNSFIVAGGFYSNTLSPWYGPHPPFRHVARWNGASWSSLGSGIEAAINTLTILPDGDIFAGGDVVYDPQPGFTAPVDVHNLARWNGAAWRAMTRGVAGPLDNAVASVSGSVIVPGRGGHPGSKYLLASEFDGVDWTPFDPDLEGEIGALSPHPDGGVVGRASVHSMPSLVNRVIVLSENVLLDLPEPPFHVWCTLASSTDRVIIGSYHGGGGHYILQLEHNTWVPLAEGLNGAVLALTRLQSGDVIAAGQFLVTANGATSSIARWDGQHWSPVGDGLTGAFEHVIEHPSGNIIALNQNQVAIWDGAAWTTIATPGAAYSLSHLSNGDLVVGTYVSNTPAPAVWRWTGQAWTPLGPDFIGASGPLRKLVRNAAGELIAVGSFSKIGEMWSTYFARWTDTNIPWVARHPQPQSTNPSESASFSAWPATGYTNLEASWQLETSPHSNTYADLIDGPIPNSLGATASITPLLTTTRPGATTLTLSNITPSLHYRRVRALINNSCGVSISNPALLTLNNATCPGDANGDNVVDFLDLNIVLSFFGASVPPGTLGDLNNDGAVDFLDLNILLSYFGTAC